jgi:hypothetical protein
LGSLCILIEYPPTQGTSLFTGCGDNRVPSVKIYFSLLTRNLLLQLIHIRNEFFSRLLQSQSAQWSWPKDGLNRPGTRNDDDLHSEVRADKFSRNPAREKVGELAREKLAKIFQKGFEQENERRDTILQSSS